MMPPGDVQGLIAGPFLVLRVLGWEGILPWSCVAMKVDKAPVVFPLHCPSAPTQLKAGFSSAFPPTYHLTLHLKIVLKFRKEVCYPVWKLNGVLRDELFWYENRNIGLVRESFYSAQTAVFSIFWAWQGKLWPLCLLPFPYLPLCIMQSPSAWNLDALAVVKEKRLFLEPLACTNRRWQKPE